MNNGLGIEDGKGSHSTRKLPILLAGGGKLGIKQGQHLVYEKDRAPLCNLHVTMMQVKVKLNEGDLPAAGKVYQKLKKLAPQSDEVIEARELIKAAVIKR